MTKLLLVGSLLFSATLATAANLSINLTGTIPVFTSSQFDVGGPNGVFTQNSFTGSYIANTPATGSKTVFVSDSHTGNELYTISISYSNVGSIETFNINSIIKDPDTIPAPAGSPVANGTAQDFTVNALGSPAIPSNITLQVTANSPVVTPEPGTSALIGIGLVVISAGRRYIGKTVR